MSRTISLTNDDPLVQVNVKMPKSLKSRLDAISVEMDMTSSQIIRDLVRSLVADHQANAGEVSNG